MIDHATIQRIIDTAEITEVVSDFVTLRRRGVNLLGHCPFHNEKTPSFTVSPAKGIFKCFGCGKGGNSVNFIMEHENLTYPEALKWLAKKYNIDVVETADSEEEKQLKDERESLMIVSAFAQRWFSRFLWEENEGRTIGLSYYHERGLRDDTIKKFELGYCPDGKSHFTEAAQKEGYKMEFLDKSGLSIVRDDWVRDRFAARVIFPIHNIAGRVIGFGGRILKEDPKAAKYLNSPESEIYHKSNILYGIFHAKREISRSDKCYLVEGYTDVLSMHQAGIENVVASSGTSLTIDQIRLIKRFTPNVTIIYDGDAAGIKASLRGIDLVLEEGLNVKVLLLPNGEDPDSFAQKEGATGFQTFIRENESDFIRFKTNLLIKDAENDPIAKARLIADVIKSVAIIPDTITRSVYIKECSKLLNVNEEILYSEVRKQKRKKHDESQQPVFKEKNLLKPAEQVVTEYKTNELSIEEMEFLRFLLKYWKYPLFEKEVEESDNTELISVGEYMLHEIETDDLVAEHAVFQTVFFEMKNHLGDDSFDPGKFFINHPDHQVGQLATELLTEKHAESKLWYRPGVFTEKTEDILDLITPRIIYEYKLRKIKNMLVEIENEINLASERNNFDEIIDLQGKYMNLKKVEKFLADQLGNRTIN